MNDYARGALEALAYVESLMTQLDRSHPDEKWKQLQSEVIGARSEILRGVVVDFRDRLRASWAFK